MQKQLDHMINEYDDADSGAKRGKKGKKGKKGKEGQGGALRSARRPEAMRRMRGLALASPRLWASTLPTSTS